MRAAEPIMMALRAQQMQQQAGAASHQDATTASRPALAPNPLAALQDGSPAAGGRGRATAAGATAARAHVDVHDRDDDADDNDGDHQLFEVDGGDGSRIRHAVPGGRAGNGSSSSAAVISASQVAAPIVDVLAVGFHSLVTQQQQIALWQDRQEEQRALRLQAEHRRSVIEQERGANARSAADDPSWRGRVMLRSRSSQPRLRSTHRGRLQAALGWRPDRRGHCSVCEWSRAASRLGAARARRRAGQLAHAATAVHQRSASLAWRTHLQCPPTSDATSECQQCVPRRKRLLADVAARDSGAAQRRHRRPARQAAVAAKAADLTLARSNGSARDMSYALPQQLSTPGIAVHRGRGQRARRTQRRPAGMPCDRHTTCYSPSAPPGQQRCSTGTVHAMFIACSS